eukprot:GFKZ01014852.1.p1 GENE.GFKZ01014852.1~~GFKZ01014852.1.p1  ORF type:complete len:675 (+),score=60.91 GFKZ01014852.1:100-2025(+)
MTTTPEQQDATARQPSATPTQVNPTTNTPAHSPQPSAPSPRSLFQVRAFVPSAKPPASSPRLTVKLMDLPDEPLLRIIEELSGSDGIRRRSVVFGPPSFPLALTCTRLLSLFKSQSLRYIDALFPETYAPYQSRAIDGQVRDSMLASIIRLAGNNLRAIHFPRDTTGINLALDEIAINRIRLRELSYSDYITQVDEERERALFTHMCDLRKLRIFNPRGALLHMHHATRLEDLELTGIRPNTLSSLVACLRKVGPTLRKLSVGFRPESLRPSPPDGQAACFTPMWCMSSFALYVTSRLKEDLPRLESLDISGSRCPPFCHNTYADQNDEAFTPVVAAFQHRINTLREKNALSNSSGRLKRLTFRAVFCASNLSAIACLVPFRFIITPSVDVYVQLVGFSVLFPAKSDLPQFKALQISMKDLTMLPASANVDCTRIESIDLGSNALCNAYSRHESVREKVLNLAWESTDVLREVNVEIEVDCVSTMQNTCSYIGHILEISPNVTELSFRTGVVDFCDEGGSRFEKLLGFMSGIRILRLTTHPAHSALCKLAFARNLPFFLESIAESCPNLECLFLEISMPVQADSIAAVEVRSVAMQSYFKCKRAVEDFEKALPDCDITSVRSQLVVWHRYLNPLNWPVLFR